MFWGWGGEDDDMANRLRIKKLFISRYPANIARYVVATGYFRGQQYPAACADRKRRYATLGHVGPPTIIESTEYADR